MTSKAAASGDQQKNDDPMKQTILIIEHKIRNLEKRKLKLEGYLQQQRDGIQLSDDKLIAASKFNEVLSTLDFARNLKKQLSSLLTTKQKKHNTDGEKLPTKIDTKIKEVLIFQNILESIKDETVKQDLLNGDNGAVELTSDEISRLTHFSKMVSPKRRVEEGKPRFEDQLKAVSKHYVKLIESKPNIIAGTSYANLKECLLKIEKCGYLDYIVKNVDKDVKTIEYEVDNSETKISQIVHQTEQVVLIDEHSSDTVINSSVPDVEYTTDKIETVYFTNNNISGNTVEQKPHQNKNTTDSVLNTSFDFLQDSLLEEDHINVNVNSIPTQTFSSSLYNKNGPTDEAILKILTTPPQHRAMGSGSYEETKLDHLENIVNGQGKIPWTGKPELNWQNRTEAGDINNLPRDNWSMAQVIGNDTNNDWLIKNNWVQMAEADKQQNQPVVETPPKNSSSNFDLVTNGYTENLNELLQKSVVFNKQDQYPVTTNANNSTHYQNYGQQSQERNIGRYTNSSSSYDRSQSTDLNKRSNSMKHKHTGGPSRGYQQSNSYVYNNRTYKNSNSHYSNNTNNDYPRISHKQ